VKPSRFRYCLLALTIPSVAIAAAPAYAAFNYCRPIIAMEADAARNSQGYFVPRWLTSSRYAMARQQLPNGATQYIYAQDPCLDATVTRTSGGDGTDWQGDVRLMAYDVRIFTSGGGWGPSLGRQAVETLTAAHRRDGWHFQDVGKYGLLIDPNGDAPPLPDTATAARPACQPWEAPDQNGNCKQFRAHY
jgi:hypothetical protein